MVISPFFALVCAVQVARDLLQELAEELLTGLPLVGAQVGPQLGLARIPEERLQLSGMRTGSWQLHENLLSDESLQQ
jgi:hypothetical protein